MCVFFDGQMMVLKRRCLHPGESKFKTSGERVWNTHSVWILTIKKKQNKIDGAEFALRNEFITLQLGEIPTPPKINVEPENDGFEDDFPFPGVYSQVPC